MDSRLGPVFICERGSVSAPLPQDAVITSIVAPDTDPTGLMIAYSVDGATMQLFATARSVAGGYAIAACVNGWHATKAAMADLG
jgi:hypothetical protein